MNNKLNKDLTRQIMVKVSEELEGAIERECVEHRKITGENISRPEKVREIIYNAIFLKEGSAKQRLQKLFMFSKLGELPRFIENECAIKASEGYFEHTVYLDHIALQKLGVFYKEQVKLLEGPNFNYPEREKLVFTYETFFDELVSELQKETGLKIDLIIGNVPIPKIKISWEIEKK